MKRQVIIVIAVGLAVFAAAFLYLQPRRPAAPRELLRTQVELRSGLLYALGENEAFDGMLVDHYENGARKAVLPIHRGKAHGLAQGWFRTGERELEEYFTAGLADGLRTRWYVNGQKRSETMLTEGRLEGRHEEWFDDGTRSLAMSHRDGKPDGFAESWHRSGVLKSRTRFDQGQIVDREFFPDTPTVAKNESAQP